MTRRFDHTLLKFITQVAIYGIMTIGVIVFINFKVDASSVITAKTHVNMAQIALQGDIVAVPENYNERVYQVAVVDEMTEIPNTVVIGCSRGMFLGEDITSFEGLYNNCVSGACMDDYYALLGLYNTKFGRLPERIIIETSPWVFYEKNPESRWLENYKYRTAGLRLYRIVNGFDKVIPSEKRENPYLSMAYFQYNREVFKKQGLSAFEERAARVSDNEEEAADYPDGSIRYEASLERQSDERLEKVKSTTSGVVYQNVDGMTELSQQKVNDYENLLTYCQNNNVEVIIYMQPFSVTQCELIFEGNTNPVFRDVSDYLMDVGDRFGIEVVGGYDARVFGLTDELFIDYSHLDKKGNEIVWNFGR